MVMVDFVTRFPCFSGQNLLLAYTLWDKKPKPEIGAKVKVKNTFLEHHKKLR